MSTPPERVRAYLELPSEQLTASTPGQFGQLLNRIMTAKELTASQVAIKARIPRSQAYNMASRTRAKLPSRPEQVRAFVEACDLAPLQVGLVMDLWAKLDKQARDQAAKAPRPAAAGDITGGGHPNIRDDRAIDASNLGRHWLLSGRAMRSWGSGQPEPVATYRPKALVDLLFLVLESDARTHRARRLLVPLMLAFVAIFAILATWAILQPAHAGMIAGVLGAAIVLPAMALKSLTRTRG